MGIARGLGYKTVYTREFAISDKPQENPRTEQEFLLTIRDGILIFGFTSHKEVDWALQFFNWIPSFKGEERFVIAELFEVKSEISNQYIYVGSQNVTAGLLTKTGILLGHGSGLQNWEAFPRMEMLNPDEDMPDMQNVLQSHFRRPDSLTLKKLRDHVQKESTNDGEEILVGILKNLNLQP